MDGYHYKQFRCPEQLAGLLLPYLEAVDENAINDLAERLKCYGISVNALTSSERYAGSILMFTKESSTRECIAPALDAASVDFGVDLEPNPAALAETPGLYEPEMSDLAVLAQGFLDDVRMEDPTYPGWGDTGDDVFVQPGSNQELLERLFLDPSQPTAHLPVQPTRQHPEEHRQITTAGGPTDVQNPLSPGLHVQSFATSLQPVPAAFESQRDGHLEDPPVRSHQSRRRSMRVSKRGTRTGNPANTLIRWASSPTATLLLHDMTPSTLAELRSLYGPGTKYDLSDKTLREAVEISKHFIRPDLICFLEEALPRWKEVGLWVQEQLPEPAAEGPGRLKLIKAYSCICKLEDRMREDQIRNRVAVVMLYIAYEQACREWRHQGSQQCHSQGRGDATRVIDDILAEMHDDWHKIDRKQHLRSRFHDKKRFGKRWMSLIKVLGMSIFIVCSSRVASVVHTTIFKAGMLEALAYSIERTGMKNLQLLRLLDPVASSLLHAGRCEKIDQDQVLKDIRSLYESGAA
ncbi:aurovertin biosynthesis cluster transcription factor aurF [Aspergillus terreus]|uniref:Aurovertin biosynthesis cluster transcription factor aurF n=1 Tax=Aspergillus terreus TaxID=33178 RepID=A0A5M3Z3R1_ASPTE|nr:hypothetical protein ATETN484_0009001700 [Aspergillus terreus]GFF17468.1 aurovertin biosynthesis cluster transcription factor aurF [Aspergillus terreus]